MRKPMLVLAWGNPSRGDDGLGWAFAETLLGHAGASLEIDVDYQLQIEHAARMAEGRGVLFVDAASAGPSPYDLRPLAPRHHRGFSSHHVPPEELLGLAIELFGQLPLAWLLAIRGYEFDQFGERLSEAARRKRTPSSGRNPSM